MRNALHVRENSAKDVWNTIKSEIGSAGRAAGQASLAAAAPQINESIQKLAIEQASDLVKNVSNAIPDRATLVALGNKIAASIEQTINEQILPELYNRKLSGAFISDNELRNLYNKALPKIPNRTTFTFTVLGIPQSITIDIQSIVRSALPFSKVQEIARKIEPLTYTVKNKAIPLVEQRITDVATFTAVTGALVGGLLVFGYMSLYNSID